MDNYKFYLLGAEIPPPKEWRDIEIMATFESNIQPNINIDSFTFTNNAKKLIEQWIEIATIFEGMPFTIIYSDKQGTVSYDGFLDFVSGYEILNPMEVRCKIKQAQGLNILDERLKALSYGYLAEIGEISKNDYIKVPVVVKKKFDLVEFTLVSFAIYSITQQLIDTTVKTAEKIINLIRIIASAPLQKPAEIIYFIAVLIVTILYYAAMLIALLSFLKVIRENLIPRRVYYKGISLKRALEIAANHIGLSLDCDIDLIDKVVYLPSKFDDKIRVNRKDEGIPNSSDFGYNLSEMFELVFRLTNSYPKIDNNTIFIRNEGSDYWLRNSNYILPDVLVENFEYNANDIVSNRLIKFEFDSTDEYTMPLKYNGHTYDNSTIFQVITDFKTTNKQAKLLKGFDEIVIPCAMAERREKLSVFELFLQTFFKTVDKVINIFGGSKLPNDLTNMKGCVLISQNYFNIPKLVYLDNGIIPSNYKNYLSAKAIYNNYYAVKSFISNPEFTQRKLYKNIKIPFKFSDYLKCVNNSYFTTINGKRGKFTKLNWVLDGDFAMCDYWIAEQYINLNGVQITETFIEA